MDFITLKIHRPRPGLNPRTLGPVQAPLDHRGRRREYILTQISYVTYGVDPLLGHIYPRSQRAEAFSIKARIR
jgi:hypothetical protein